MSEMEKPTWAYSQTMKINAYNSGEMNVARYWQNEQIMKKLTDILFVLKEKNV
jgi:hypothetical protein